MESPIAGWYPDPSGDTTKHRYWNGEQWTENFRDAATLAPISTQAVVQEAVVTAPAAGQAAGIAAEAAATTASTAGKPADIIVQPPAQAQQAQPAQQAQTAQQVIVTQPSEQPGVTQPAQGTYAQQPYVQQPYAQQPGAQPYAQQPYMQQPYAQGPAYTGVQSDNTLLLIAFIFAIIGTVGLSITIIGLAWGIPMTVHTYKIYKGEKECTTAFAVCTLLFLSLVSGILLLVDSNNRKR